MLVRVALLVLQLGLALVYCDLDMLEDLRADGLSPLVDVEQLILLHFGQNGLDRLDHFVEVHVVAHLLYHLDLVADALPARLGKLHGGEGQEEFHLPCQVEYLLVDEAVDEGDELAASVVEAGEVNPDRIVMILVLLELRDERLRLAL